MSSTEDLVVSIVQAERVILGGMIATVPSCMSEDNMTLDTVPLALSSWRDFLPVDMCGELVVVGKLSRICYCMLFNSEWGTYISHALGLRARSASRCTQST